mmetsp:Transcript_30910/g.91793  ORF Transcript_30910/g.91793 Transcript_30910/m.91793 type:complete len:244 (+) Transcript_30910:3-734(+)
MPHDGSDRVGVGGDRDLDHLAAALDDLGSREGPRAGGRGSELHHPRDAGVHALHLVVVGRLPPRAPGSRELSIAVGVVGVDLPRAEPVDVRLPWAEQVHDAGILLRRGLRFALLAEVLLVPADEAPVQAVREPEVDDLDAARRPLQLPALHHDVGRLQVAVHHPLRVHVQHGGGQLCADRPHGRCVERPALAQDVAQVAARAQLQRNAPRVLRGLVRCVCFNDLDDVGTYAPSHRLHLLPDLV